MVLHIARQEHRDLGRGGKVEKGSISPGALLLALLTTVVLSIFISSLQKAAQKTTQGKANTAMAKYASKSQIWMFLLSYDQGFS